MLCLIASVYLQNGDTFGCLAMLNRALRTAANTGERLYLAETYRLRGQAELIAADHRMTKSVHDSFSRSLQIAHEQGAVVWQAKTVNTLKAIDESLGYSSAKVAGSSADRKPPLDDSDSGANLATGLDLLKQMARHI